MSKVKSTRLNCFSSPVMIATLMTETGLAIYTLWRYKLDEYIKIALATLVCLASFQLAEYHVCTGFGSTAEVWSRFGFIMITALPPLALHMMYKLTGYPGNKVVYGAYFSMAAFVLFFLTYHSAFIGHQCTGNYVIFQLGQKVGGTYGLYYYGWLGTGIYLGLKRLNELKSDSKELLNKIQAIKGLVASYFVFLLPTALVNSIKPQSRQAIPSVMCGFAVIYALILVFYIIPRVTEVSIFTKDQLKKA